MIRFFILFLLTASLAFAQQPISQQLNSFSPLAQVYLKHLGLTDKNNNGIIDKDAEEGYEAFTAKYGNADIGFLANGVTYGTNNNRLEEPEIINHYYINIRFKPDFETETTAIENEVKAFVYANNLPLVWLDDQQGTVMNAVNTILGEGWQEKEVTEDEAVQMLTSVLKYRLRINARPGMPSNDNGYFSLPEFVTKKSGYCYEVAQFGFWFFTQLKINSIHVGVRLSKKYSHSILKLNSGRIIDVFDGMMNFKIADNRYAIENPLQVISIYYHVLAKANDKDITFQEYAFIYDKYDLPNSALLMYSVDTQQSPDYAKIITIGEFVLNNINIPQLMQSKHYDAEEIRDWLSHILYHLSYSYYETRDSTKLKQMQELLKKTYKKPDKYIQHILKLEVYQ